MRVKFRLCLDDKSNRITRLYFVNDDESLDMITEIPGWSGLDFNSIPNEVAEDVADAISTRVDNSKYIE